MAVSRSTLLSKLVVVAATITGALSQASVQVEPPTQMVRQGQPAHLMCRSGVPILYCRMERLSGGVDGGKSWFLREDMTTSTDPNAPVYEGAGYAAGQCGMSISRMTEALSGSWVCTMGPATGSQEIRGYANITVAKAPLQPELSVSPGGQTGTTYEFQQGDTLRARCAVANGRPPANISWYIDSEEITQGLSSPMETPGVDNTWTVSQNLTHELRWQDNGKQLRCVAQHIAYDERSRNQSVFSIRVLFPPQPHNSPIEKFGFEVGSEGVVVVTVEANPQPQLTWEVDGQTISQGTADPTNHFQAGLPTDLGGGLWEATLRITRVEAQDVGKSYRLRASNRLGSETYSIALSTSSEPEVMALGAGAIIGIVVAILVLLLVIFLLIFARATGRWCFKARGQKGTAGSHTDSEAHIDPEHVQQKDGSGADNPSVNHHASTEYVNGNGKKEPIKDDKDTPV